MRAVTYPRRQQYRRLCRAAGYLVAAITIGISATIAATVDQLAVALALAAAAIGCGLRARSWMRLAERSRIGARSEDEVQRALALLEQEGWRIRHSLRWAGRGDIDSVAIAPTGIGFVIETKTTRFDLEQLHRLAEMTAWLQTRRRSWCPHGAAAVLCVARARHVQQARADALIVSLDQLVAALRIAAGTQPRPAFLPGHEASRPTAGGGTRVPGPA